MSYAAPSIWRLTLAHTFGLLVLLFGLSTASAAMVFFAWFPGFQRSISSEGVSVSVFMTVLAGGMALGAFGSDRWLSRFHPLRAWAVLQLGFAIVALVITRMKPEQGLAEAALAWRVAGAGLFIVAPAILSGALLPCMFKTARQARPQGAHATIVLPVLTGSAMLGVLYAALLILRRYDTNHAAYIAFAAGVTCAGFAGSLASLPGERVAEPVTDRGVMSWPLLFASAFVGMTISGAPVLWTRLLSMLLGGSPYTLALVVAIMLAGITVGYVVAALFQKGDMGALLRLSWCELLAAPALAWSAAMVGQNLPRWPVSADLAIAPRFTFHLDLARVLFSLVLPCVVMGAILGSLRPVVGNGRRRLTFLAGGVLLGPVVITMVLAGTTPAFAQRLLLLLPSIAAILTVTEAYGAEAPGAAMPRSAYHVTLVLALALPLLSLLVLYLTNFDNVPPEILAQ